MRHLKIFESMDDIDPMVRDLFDVWEYIPISKYSDEYRLRGTGNNREEAQKLAVDINFARDHLARVTLAERGDDDLSDDDVANMINHRPRLKNELIRIGYVLVNRAGEILAPF